MKKFEYPLVLYPLSLVVIVEPDIQYICDTYNDIEGNSISDLEDVDSSDAFTFICQNKKTHKTKVVICFSTKKKITYSITAHEAVHAAKEIFEYIHADINPHEPFEYLVGYIANCCYKSMLKLK